jgi:pimeloyl-ACP methyl ester carboxylesterase
MLQENPPVFSPPTSGQGLAAALPWLMAEMHRINLLHQAGNRQEAIEQFHALASVAVRAQREDLTGQGYIVRGHTSDVSVFRIPARPRPDKPIALFLPGLLTSLPLTAARVLAFVDLFDIVVCELPGHGASGEVADVSLDAFAAEYAALLDIALRHAGSLFVIGESLGGLVALSLAHLRPDRIRNVVLLDTPFHLTRPDPAAWISESWRNCASRPYPRRICVEIMGFDPVDSRSAHTMLHHHMVREAPFNCLLIAGGERLTSGVASVVTADDIAMLQTVNPNLLVAQRVPGTGHAILLDNPDGARAALQTYIVDCSLDS